MMRKEETKMKTKRELNLEYWGRIHDMCDGTDVKPWECVKFEGHIQLAQPVFGGDPSCYEFAVAILEGKPVFVEDIIYMKEDGTEYKVTFPYGFDSSKFTWTKPTKNRTFTLNGAEFPCPVKEDDGNCIVLGGKIFYFHDADSREIVTKHLVKILSEAKEKP